VKSTSPRNLLEVYQSEPSLLSGPRNVLKPLTEEYVEQETKKSRRVRLRRPVKINPDKVGWTTGSKRAGTISVKLGMSALWLKDGRRVPVTLLQIKDCQVVQTRISRQHGGNDHKTELQVGAVDETQLYKVRKAQFGHFKKHGVNPKKKVASFRVTRNALLHPGTPLHAAHYYPGQFVKIQGVTKDKGFQGVMKRWKMKGQPASHGQTKTHRKMGATGGGTDPGRIWPGKRMAGHMGNKNCTKFAVRILRINTKYNVLYVKGECPGEKGGFIVISDAWKKHERPPPFPTYFPDPENPLPEDLYADDVQQFEETIYFTKDRKSGKA